MSTARRVEELQKARAEMTGVRERIGRAVAGRSDGERLAPPADGGWSAAEVLDHIGTAERKLVRALLKLEKGEPVRLPQRVYWYRLPMSPVFWRFRLKAPKLVRPRERAAIEPREVIQGLSETRRDLFALADRYGPDRFSRLVFPHFVLGRFTGLSWFRFLARHEGRHAGQLERALGIGTG